MTLFHILLFKLFIILSSAVLHYVVFTLILKGLFGNYIKVKFNNTLNSINYSCFVYLSIIITSLIFVNLYMHNNIIFSDFSDLSMTINNQNVTIKGELIKVLSDNLSQTFTFIAGARIAAIFISKHSIGFLPKWGIISLGGTGLALQYRILSNLWPPTVKTSFSKALDSLLKEEILNQLSIEQKEAFIKSVMQNKVVFSQSGALLVAISLYGIVHSILSSKPLAMKLGISFFSGGENVDKSILLPFLNKNKFSKLTKPKKIFILIIISILSFLILSNIHLGWFKLIKFIAFLFNILIVLYYLYCVLILVKNLNLSNSEKNMNIPKYYPSKLKNQILFLLSIDNINLAKLYIKLYLYRAIYTFLLLLIFIAVNIFIENYIVFKF